MERQFSTSRRTLLKLGSGLATGLSIGAYAGTPAVAQDGESIRIWSPGDNGSVADWSQDPILQAVQEATGVSIEITKIGGDTYQDQVNAAIASGDLPDVIATIDHGQNSLISQWVRDGVVTPYDGEASAPNVTAQYAGNPTLDELKIDGQIYMKPVSWGDGNEPNAGLLHIRKDLLDAYGLEPPDTFEQYFEYLRAAQADGLEGVVFAGGGTGGLGAAINAFAGAHGLPFGGWVAVDGGYQHASIQPGMRDALILFRQMVAEGLVDVSSFEIANADQSRDRYVSGATASYIFNGGGHIGRIQNDMTLANPAFIEHLLPALDAGAGSRGYMSEPMFYGGTFLGNLDGTNPAAAARVVDYLSSEEGYRLTAIGVEGIDYEEVEGEITLLPARAERGFPVTAGDTGAHPLASAIVSWVPLEWQEFSLLYGKPAEFQAWFAEMRANQVQYQVESIGLLTTSPLWTDFQATGSELQARAFLDIVQSGSDDDATAAFDQFVGDWNGAGGEAAQAEMSEVLTGIYG